MHFYSYFVESICDLKKKYGIVGETLNNSGGHLDPVICDFLGGKILYNSFVIPVVEIREIAFEFFTELFHMCYF